MNGTLFDIGIDFGYHEETGPPEAYPVRVVMSWEHARQLVDLLEQNLNAYEEQIRAVEPFVEDEDAADGDD